MERTVYTGVSAVATWRDAPNGNHRDSSQSVAIRLSYTPFGRVQLVSPSFGSLVSRSRQWPREPRANNFLRWRFAILTRTFRSQEVAETFSSSSYLRFEWLSFVGTRVDHFEAARERLTEYGVESVENYFSLENSWPTKDICLPFLFAVVIDYAGERRLPFTHWKTHTHTHTYTRVYMCVRIGPDEIILTLSRFRDRVR